MKSDITFGQYVEGDSLIHRLDPRIKIIASFPERGGSARSIRKVAKQQEKYHKKNAKEQETRIAKA